MTDKILLVDDDPNILYSYQRVLRQEFHVDIAFGGQTALTTIDRNGPYAVVLTDLRMPHMDGVELLTLVRNKCPDTVRMMLTGNADLEAAAKAINQGHIFRFLAKPCDNEPLRAALVAGLEQYRLIMEEKQLLEQTLRGTIQVLTEVLSVVSPAAFGRAMRIHRYVHHIVQALSLRSSWQIEIAAMLSQLGCVALPPEIIETVYAGGTLPQDQQLLYDQHPRIARDLLSSIARMEPVGWIVFHQDKPVPLQRDFADQDETDLRVAVEILQSILAFDALLQKGLSRVEAANRVARQRKGLHRQVMEALVELEPETSDKELRRLQIAELIPGMIIEQEIRTQTGSLVATKGQEVTVALLLGLTRLQEAGTLDCTISVSLPKGLAMSHQKLET